MEVALICSYSISSGYDAVQLVQDLKVEIINGNVNAGLDMNNGCIGCMEKLGITVIHAFITNNNRNALG